ncbi:hypothetical protein GGR54DRAFT_585407 [Hypoxylon sp. NC1633]|nr:hypothetical protein GGR54DRAFT_585407 [Hypoxylon sp. NC1633]
MASVYPPKYVSAVEYQFSEEEVNDILRVTSYPSDDYAQRFISFTPEIHAPIRQSIATPFQRPSEMGVGSLSKLPLEVLQSVFLHMDMRSVFNFRQTCSHSRRVVDSTWQYQVAVKHGLDLYCGLLRTQCTVPASLSDFYEALCTKTCSNCGAFGGFINLLRWKKYCNKCAHQSDSTRVQSFVSAKREFNFTKSEIKALPSLKTIPGYYAIPSYIRLRNKVVSCTDAFAVAGVDYYRTLSYDYKFAWMTGCALPYYDKKTGEVEHGVLCRGCLRTTKMDRFPNDDATWAAFSAIHTKEGFMAHFRWCDQAQIMWRSSNGGTRHPPEMLEVIPRLQWYEQAAVLNN